MEKYTYLLYGFVVFSDVFIRELKPITYQEIKSIPKEKYIDIKITDKMIDVEKKIKKGIKCSFDKKLCFFLIDNIGIYCIQNGNLITVKKIGNSKFFTNFILGSSFGCLFAQKGIVAVHGAAGFFNDSSFIITGKSGCGKSTLMSALTLKGYRFLSDDISVLNMSSTEIDVCSGYAKQKLCSDAALKLGIDINKCVKIDEGRNKYEVSSYKVFEKEPKKLKFIFEIEKSSAADNVSIKEVTGINKIRHIFSNIYRNQIVSRIGLSDSYVKMIIDVSMSVKYYIMTRPDDTFYLDDQIKKIDNLLLS